MIQIIAYVKVIEEKLPVSTFMTVTIKPIELLVLVSFTHYCASTPSLSTW